MKPTGQGLALEVEGTFASYYEPGRDVTGSVWDAIAAPVLALAPERRREILILGVAGGSAARVVRAIAKDAHITGVELSPEVIEAARAHFDLDALGLEIEIADALEFLRTSRRQFDLILEDVFVGVGRGVHKPGWLPEPGHELARARLKPGGLLVSNTLDEAGEVVTAMRGRFPGVVRIEVEDYENVIVVGGPDWLSGSQLRRAVSEDPVLAPSLPALSFRSLRRGAR